MTQRAEDEDAEFIGACDSDKEEEEEEEEVGGWTDERLQIWNVLGSLNRLSAGGDSASGYPMSRGPQAGRPPQVPWGLAGEREENEAELGVVFGPNPGAIVHFSTSSLTSLRPPKRIAARAASQRLPRPFGPRQPRLPVVAKLRNFPENFGRHTAFGSS